MLPLALIVRVIVMTPESTAPPDGFVEALGIQLAGVGVVEAGPAVPPGALADQAIAAAHAVDERDAALAVWVVTEYEEHYQLNIVGRRDERLFVERLPLTAEAGPDLARTLALKVGAVLDTLIKDPEATSGGEVTWVEEPPKTDTSTTTTTTTDTGTGTGTATVTVPLPPPRRRLWGFFELGARGLGGINAPAAQASGELGVGARLALGAVELDGYALFRYDAGLSEQSPDGAVETTELAAGLGVRATVPVWNVRAGGQLEGGARRVSADGQTPAGASGSIDVIVPAVSVAGCATLVLTDRLEARFAAGFETAPIAQSLTVNDIRIVALGRNRGFAEAALVFVFP